MNCTKTRVKLYNLYASRTMMTQGRLEKALVKFIHAGHLSMGQVVKETGLTYDDLYRINRELLAETEDGQYHRWEER